MSEPIDLTNPLLPEDEALLAELGGVIELADPAPAEIVAAGKASFTWLTVDAELAELAFDSLVDEEAGVLVRGAANDQPRLLTFRAGAVEIEVEATRAGGSFRLLGQVVPAASGEIEVRHPAGSRTVTADDLGRFSAEEVAAGSVSLRWRPAGAAGPAGPAGPAEPAEPARPAGPAVTTEWITL